MERCIATIRRTMDSAANAANSLSKTGSGNICIARCSNASANASMIPALLAFVVVNGLHR
jgi:hypothetical protein